MPFFECNPVRILRTLKALPVGETVLQIICKKMKSQKHNKVCLKNKACNLLFLPSTAD